MEKKLLSEISKEQKERIESILAFISLTDKKFEKASSLSHGQKQWLEIGMLLVQEPTVLLLDEPAAGMNPNETAELMDTIRFIREKDRF